MNRTTAFLRCLVHQPIKWSMERITISKVLSTPIRCWNGGWDLIGEGMTMSYTMADFRREYAVDKLTQMTPEQRREFLRCVCTNAWKG